MKQLRHSRYISVALVLAITIAFVLWAYFGLVRMTNPGLLGVSTLGVQPPVIIVDPGHGGADGGAVGVDGIIEAGINLEISFILRDLFVISGFEVEMTREDDISIHSPGVEGLRAQKTSDLRNRLAFTERFTNNIFISVHQNKFGDASQWGTQIFYGPKHSGSGLLAEIVQRNVVSMMQPENKRQQKQGGDNLYIIHSARSPAILVEGGFLSNPGDARSLTNPDYQAKLAFAIFGSVMEYLGMELPVSLA